MAENTTAAKAPMGYTVRNLARDPQSRVKRRLRPGNKTGFLLADGTRLRRLGARATELDTKTLEENKEALAEGVEHGYIEICDPSGRPMTPAQILGKAAPPAKTKKEPPAKTEPEMDTQAEPQEDTQVEKPKKKGILGRKKESKE